MSSALLLAAPYGPYGPGPGPGWPLFLIPLFWITLLVVVVALVARRRRFFAEYGVGPGLQPGRGAESTLAERFAQGDIDEVEYRARLEVLRANRPGAAR